MHRRFISTVAMLMVMTLCLTGCTSEASNVGKAKDKKTVDTGFTVATAGSYDSADTAVVISTDQENSAVVFMNMETGKQYTLYYDGTTYVKDKHDGPMTISQIEPGDVVDVTFLKGKKRLASIQRSPQAWVYDGIENYDLGGPNKTASIGSNTYSLPDDVVVLSEGRRSEVMDVVKQDVLTVSGIDHKIYSISVERGHGYLRLKNDQALIGGWIEVGNSVIREITEDMLLVVPEGSYQVLLSYNGVSCTKEVMIERNKEVILDVGDLEITENKTGRILFNVTPDTAKVSIDGKAVDISKAVELPYGIHQVHLEAKGYDSLTKYIQVGSEYATISFELEEERDDDDRRTVSSNTVEDYQPNTQRPSVSDNSLGSLSENALGTKNGNRVYIDAPKNVEVYLDSNYIGISPISFKKTIGSHTVTLRKSGYKTKSYTIYLYNDGEDITYSFTDLEQETVSGNTTKPDGSVSGNSVGKISFSIIPENATVTIDSGTDEEQKISDLDEEIELKYGEHTIHIEAEGYKSWDGPLKVNSERRTFECKLEPIKVCEVNLLIKPEDVSTTVKVDGEDYGEDIKGEIQLKLEYGKHTVQVEADNYESELSFEAASESEEIECILTKKKKSVKISINPNDIDVEVEIDEDSKYENVQGEMEVELEYGTHKIQIKADGYETKEDNFEVNSESADCYYELVKLEEPSNPSEPDKEDGKPDEGEEKPETDEPPVTSEDSTETPDDKKDEGSDTTLDGIQSSEEATTTERIEQTSNSRPRVKKR